MFTTRGRVVGVVAAVIVVLTALVAALLLGRPAVHAQETGFTSHTIRVTPKYQETKILSSSPKGVTFTWEQATISPFTYGLGRNRHRSGHITMMPALHAANPTPTMPVGVSVTTVMTARAEAKQRNKILDI
jgi:hypothetical protein